MCSFLVSAYEDCGADRAKEFLDDDCDSFETPPQRAWARNEWVLVGAILLLVTVALSLAARG